MLDISTFTNWKSNEGVVEIKSDGKIKVFKAIEPEHIMLVDFPSVPHRTISLPVISNIIEPCRDVE
jgi:hypothetical protein